jgi:hypothetical protein
VLKKVKNLEKNANVILKALKLEFETFGPMSQPVLKKLCVGKPKLKRQAQPKSRFLLLLQVQVLLRITTYKKYKDAFDSIIQCLEERFGQNSATGCLTLKCAIVDGSEG